MQLLLSLYLFFKLVKLFSQDIKGLSQSIIIPDLYVIRLWLRLVKKLLFAGSLEANGSAFVVISNQTSFLETHLHVSKVIVPWLQQLRQQRLPFFIKLCPELIDVCPHSLNLSVHANLGVCQLPLKGCFEFLHPMRYPNVVGFESIIRGLLHFSLDLEFVLIF